MNKHHGQILKKIIEEKDIKTESLISLLHLNKAAIGRLYESTCINWDTIATIGRLISHDFRTEFPELAESAINKYKKEFAYLDEQVGGFAKIYLIDDSELDTLVFKLMLGQVKKEFQLNTFNNGEVAINKLLEISINCPEKMPEHIFLDLKMPKMDGRQFLEHFQRLNIDPNHTVKIHILTSSIFYTEINKYTAHPLVNTFITKPVKTKVITDIIM